MADATKIPYPILSLEGHLEPYQSWMIVILTIVLVFGVPGNVLVFAVYYSKTKKTSTHVFILTMAILDMFITIFSIARIVHWLYESSYETPYKCQGYQVFGSWSEFFSAFMTTTIAADRYFQICRPHFPMTIKKALLCSLIGLGISNMFSIPVAFLYGIEDNKCQITKDGLALYIPLTLAFACFIFLMVTALVLYTLVYLEVRKRFQNRAGSAIFVRPSESTAIDSERGQTTAVTHVGEAVRVIPKDKDTRGKHRESNGSKPVACSRRSSVTFLGVKIERRSEGSAKVEVGRTEMTVGKKMKIDANVNPSSPMTTEIRNACKVATTEIGHVDKQYEDLMTAILETKVTSREDVVLRPGSSANNRRLSVSLAGANPLRSSGRTGRMLLLATVVFVGTWTARCIMWLITNTESEWWNDLRFENPHAFAFLTVLQHIYYTTPAINPVIYSFANPRFRSDSIRMLKDVKSWRNKVFPG